MTLLADSLLIYSYSVLEQPFKIPFAAAVVLAANTKKPELTAEILKKVQENLDDFIGKGLWREVKLVLRFLACLQGALEENGLFPVLEDIFSRAVDLQTASSEDVCPFLKPACGHC